MSLKRSVQTSEDLARPPKGPKTEVIVRIAVIGPEKVGKTTFTYQVAQKGTPSEEELNSDPEKHSVLRVVEDKVVKVEIIDSKDKDSIKDVQGVLIMFDTTSPKSFGRVKEFWSKLPQHIKEEKWQTVSVALIANKCDVESQGTHVTEEEGRAFAQSHGWEFFMASASQNINTTNLLDKILAKIMGAEQPMPLHEDAYMTRLMICFDDESKEKAKVLQELLKLNPEDLEDDGKEVGSKSDELKPSTSA